MIYIKTEAEIEAIRASCFVLSKTLGEIASAIRPGVTTLELDKIAYDFIQDHKGKPAFLGYSGFPNSICASPNEQVVHGIPNETPLRDGDILSVDCGVVLNGYYSDCAYTFTIGEISSEIEALLAVTKQSLYLGIAEAIHGSRVGNISAAIQNYNESFSYTVVRELVGHGLGKKLHEDPQVPNYGRRGAGPLLKRGMVLAIEPMINMGKRDIVVEKDNWTVRTRDRQPSAHFEHTVVVRDNQAEVLTSYEFIDQALKK